MKRNEYVIIAVTLLVVVAIVLFFKWRRPSQAPTQVATPYPTHHRSGACPGETKTFKADDNWMKGIIENGQKFDVITNYYDCNAPKIGDVVYYSLSSQLPPVVKRVVAAGGDHFKVVRDKQNQTWDLIVNGEYVKMVTDPKANYYFGSNNPATLSLYEKSHDGVLRPDEVILFSTWSPGDKDSGLFGVANVVDIIGKVKVNSDGKP